jgi:hypothetical protein
MPDHGILVRLSNDPSCRMDVSGEFDSGLDPSLNAYAKRLMDDDKRKQGFTLLTRVDAALGSLPAVRFVVRYMDTASHGPVVVERLLAKRDLDDPPDLSIIYGFYLETPEDRYAEMAPIFRQFLQSWKQTKVSD